MENNINQYFKEEKAGALVLLVASVLLISIGLYFILKSANPTFRGMAYPILLFGFLELVIGGAVFLRTDKQVAGLQKQYQATPSVFKQQESARMEKVMRNFKMVKVAEIVFIVIAILLMIFLSGKSFWVGIGIGLLVQCSFLLAFDTIADQRGEQYYDSLNQLQL